MWKIELPTPGLEEQVVGTQVKQQSFCQKCAECVNSECIHLIAKGASHACSFISNVQTPHCIQGISSAQNLYLETYS